MKRIAASIAGYLSLLLFCCTVTAQTGKLPAAGDQQYRPLIHFTPKAHWINDPNGMVFNNGIYHLFFQYHPYSSIWGPMHWGHATSKDLVHWKRQPIAIYPDSLGTIFSGSAVVDKNNSTGFGKNGKTALVAMFTHHNAAAEKEGRNDFQNQSIAYSLDNGNTWTKYKQNPVIKNPGIRDFRDPKVTWYEPQKKWIVSIATKDAIVFYSSPDMKSWTKESEFGQDLGAHGGGWECPDLFAIDDNGTERWVLIVNLNPGAPNGGSGTQYFIGDFDGKQFTSAQKETRWLDYGPDNYAGITWSNTGKRKIFLGWMSNWLYANQVPTETFRNAMTIPRELKIKHVGDDALLSSEPVKELASLHGKQATIENVKIKSDLDIVKKTGPLQLPCRLNLDVAPVENFSLTFSNKKGEQLIVGYDHAKNEYFIDRTKSGKTDFQKDFSGRHTAPRLATTGAMTIQLVIDVNSVELFADDGLTVMTELFFSNQPFNQLHLKTDKEVLLQKLQYVPLKSIW